MLLFTSQTSQNRKNLANGHCIVDLDQNSHIIEKGRFLNFRSNSNKLAQSYLIELCLQFSQKRFLLHFV